MASGGRIAGRSVADVLRPWADEHRTASSSISGDRRLTYGQVDEQAEALAAALHELGIGRGDRVALDLPNWPEFIISMFAVARLGAVMVPLNPRYTVPELRYMLRHSEAAAVVSAENFGGVRLPAALRGAARPAAGPPVRGHGGRRRPLVRRSHRPVRGPGLERRRPLSAAHRREPGRGRVRDPLHVRHHRQAERRPAHALGAAGRRPTRPSRPSGSPRTMWCSASRPCSTSSASGPASWGRRWPARRWCCRSSSTRPKLSS